MQAKKKNQLVSRVLNSDVTGEELEKENQKRKQHLTSGKVK